MQEQDKDLSLLRPFDLEKSKAGEVLCDILDKYKYVFIGYSKTTDNVYIQVIDETEDTIYECSARHLRMKPLCWLEGKPVYKGDELWHTNKDMKEYNYIVKDYDTDGYIKATENSLGRFEYLHKLSWNKQQEDKKEIPEVLHDLSKFKVGDKVKIVRGIPVGDYSDKGWNNDWTYAMDKYVGEEFIVKGSYERGVDVAVGYFFPSSVLELVEAAKEKPTKLLEIYLDGELIKQEYIEV